RGGLPGRRGRASDHLSHPVRPRPGRRLQLPPSGARPRRRHLPPRERARGDRGMRVGARGRDAPDSALGRPRTRPACRDRHRIGPNGDHPVLNRGRSSAVPRSRLNTRASRHVSVGQGSSPHGGTVTTTLAGGRAARRQTMRRIRPRRSPAVPLLLAVGAGAVAVLWLWWSNTPSIADTTGKIVAAGRITGLLAGYLMALVVLQMARVPALERRVGSGRAARWRAVSGRYTVSPVIAHVFLTMWGYALQAGKSLGDIVDQTVTSINTLPDMGKAAI